MDNFGFLKKRELSYIFKNRSKFGTQLINQIEDYCQRKKISIKKIESLKPEWEEDTPRLNFELKNDQIRISKTEEAKKADNNRYLFGIIALGIILIFCVYEIFANSNHDSEFWYVLIGLPITLALLVGVIIKQRRLKNKLGKERVIEINRSSLLRILENGQTIEEYQIKTVNLFWTGDQDAGDFPKVLLVLNLIEKKAILIDEEGNHLESLRCGNEIAKFLDKRLNFFYGNIPFSSTIEL